MTPSERIIGYLARFFSSAKTKISALLFMIVVPVAGCLATPFVVAEDSLYTYLDGLDARVGVAAVWDDGGFMYHADDDFPMLSVVKFPVALAVAERAGDAGSSFYEKISVRASQLHENTYSPMLRRYPAGADCEISVIDLLEYSLGQSDNNACDILIEYVGGVDSVASCLHRTGYDGIVIEYTEDDMHQDIMRSYLNTSTPYAMARLLSDFDRHADDGYAQSLKRIMESCATGRDRLARPLEGTGAVVGHKTGTGDVNSLTGRIIAVNDAGYVHLPDGRSYAIAVFVADSAYSMADTSAIIAKISELVYALVMAEPALR